MCAQRGTPPDRQGAAASWPHLPEGAKFWTLAHDAWVRRRRVADELAQRAVDHMLAHLHGLNTQIAVVDHKLKPIAARKPWPDAVA
jgi:hypothetical protein